MKKKNAKNPAKKPESKNKSDAVSSVPELAKILRCSGRTIRNWIGEGMPVLPDKTFDVQAIRQWRESRDNRKKPSESEELDNNIKKVKLKQLELEHKARLGELISLEEVEKGRVARILAVKQELLAIPRAMAKVLENLDARQIEALLKDKMNQVIVKFSGQ